MLSLTPSMAPSMARIRFVLLRALLLLPLTAAAQQGDIEAGKAKSTVCAACHGANGHSSADEFPHLAGQVAGYIAAQLVQFKSGDRENTVMAGLVTQLTDQDMADLDAYYSAQAPAVAAIQPQQEADALAGQRLFRSGYGKFNIPACMGCHGPAGHGIPPHFPRLAGQSPAYISSQLKAYQSRQRFHPIMTKIAYSLSSEQIEQLAIYLSGLN